MACKKAAYTRKRKLNKDGMKKDMAWASWKKIVEEYGEEEGKERVKAGLILMRRDPEGKKQNFAIPQGG